MMGKNDLPLHLEKEREELIRQVEYEAKKLDVFGYVKPLSLLGLVFAVVTFINVGPRSEAQYGFEGSVSMAFMAALGVFLVFVGLGVALGLAKKRSVRSKIGQIRANYDAKVRRIPQDHTPVVSRFSDYAHVRRIIDWTTKSMEERIRAASRAVTVPQIDVSVDVRVCATEVRYDWDVFRFSSLNLAELTSPVDRAELAQVIAENAAVHIRKLFPRDLSGAIPEVSVIIEGHRAGAACVTIRYRCANGWFEEARPW